MENQAQKRKTESIPNFVRNPKTGEVYDGQGYVEAIRKHNREIDGQFVEGFEVYGGGCISRLLTTKEAEEHFGKQNGEGLMDAIERKAKSSREIDDYRTLSEAEKAYKRILDKDLVQAYFHGKDKFTFDINLLPLVRADRSVKLRIEIDKFIIGKETERLSEMKMSEDIYAAVRNPKTGEIYEGRNHLDALSKAPEKTRDQFAEGFMVHPNGCASYFVTRKNTQKYYENKIEEEDPEIFWDKLQDGNPDPAETHMNKTSSAIYKGKIDNWMTHIKAKEFHELKTSVDNNEKTDRAKRSGLMDDLNTLNKAEDDYKKILNDELVQAYFHGEDKFTWDRNLLPLGKADRRSKLRKEIDDFITRKEAERLTLSAEKDAEDLRRDITFVKVSGIQFQVITIGVVLMLIWALYPHNPYGYYNLLRWVCCLSFGYLAFIIKEKNDKMWSWFLGGALIYNPIFSLHLGREIWSVVNIATVGVLIVFTYRNKFFRIRNP